ncbi:type I-G CRISPR-associated protein Csb2 [Steroidobacter cummioxidans]|uniref:type I-G CRISPR-associated protein Csb2 n=1 Tax=Steroidobacter cummioxidans TaxID=1803913 RepID=UPI000E318D2A|nr:type I-U CRISPR-associated protein Csb2 [Steroidobacter cummioxidans]
MLAIEVEFLMGRAVISQVMDRTQAEWPPHPQRLFSALVAAYGELGEQGDNQEQALRWLEGLPPPEIKADLSASLRSSPSYFVPVNDEVTKAVKDKNDFRHVLDRRTRQERFFPAAVPGDPVVVFQWPCAPGLEQHRAALRGLVENLTYVGHSSSPVRACLREQPVQPSLCPTNQGEISLRVPSSGRFDRLVTTHELREIDESIQPPLGRFQSYQRPSLVRRSIFSENALVVALEGGPRLGLDSTLPLIQHVRNALLARFGSSVSELLCGHDAEGKMTRQPHLAILPLGFVDSGHADGALKGIAFVLPSTASTAERRKLRAALAGPWQLHLGPLGSMTVRYIDPFSRGELKALDFSVYTQESDVWASVTPIVLDRHPKKNGAGVEAVIAMACERIGLPAPVEVRLGCVSAISGAPTERDFHGRSKQVDGKVRRHAVIRFGERVRGPLMLGAGRFIGLGLCMPLRKSKR